MSQWYSRRASYGYVLGLLTATTVALLSSALAESKSKTVGLLSPGFKGSALSSRKIAIEKLAHFGFVEGMNLVVKERYADGDTSRLTALASELMAEQPDVIIAVSNPAIQAAKIAAPSVPIIMAFAGEDPVAAGFVASLSRPGGSITGLVMLAAETDVKRVELAAEAMPSGKRVGLLMTRYAPDGRIQLLQRSAASMGIELVLLRVQDRTDYDAAFKTLAGANVDVLVLGSSPVFVRDVAELAARATAIRLPLVCEWGEMAHKGCLFAYGPNPGKLYERIGDYTGRVLRGTMPQELPVEQPTTFELVLNLKTARELGVAISPALNARADEVIE